MCTGIYAVRLPTVLYHYLCWRHVSMLRLSHRRRRIFILCLLCVPGIIPPTGIHAEAHPVAALLESRGYSPAEIGVYATRLYDDSLLYALHSDSALIPASALKLFTAAAAFDYLGPTYTFKTTIHTDGNFNADNGVMSKTCYIRGDGDPGFTAQRLWLFVIRMKHRGIREIHGDVCIDDSYFDTRITGPGFSTTESSRAYQAPVGALSASFNCIGVHVRPGEKIGSPVHVDLLPPRVHTKIICTAKTLAPNKAGGISIRTKKYNNSSAVMVYGSMAPTDEPRYIYRKAWHTWENFGNTLSALFAREGITVKGSVRRGVTPDSVARDTLLVYESKPLHEHVQSMCKYSNNFIAEMLYKKIAAVHDSPPGTWKKGAAALSHWWTNIGSQPGSLTVCNGSGMGDKNRVSAHQMGSLLSYIHDSTQYYPELLNALPCAGIDGTLSRRFTNSICKGHVRAKTGTLNDYGVHTLAGYILVPNEPAAFAILINSTQKSQYYHWQTQRKIVEEIYRLQTRKE